MATDAPRIRLSARLALTLLTAPALASAQIPAQLPAPPATASDALHQMADQAGIIFTGQVTAIRHPRSTPGSTGVVEIDFAVTDSVLGPASGSVYTLREWAGLWPANDTPFAVGRRYLMLLHAPGASGLSSPVGGQDGAIPILGAGPAAQPQAFDTRTAAASPEIAAPAPVSYSASRSPARSALRIATISDTPTTSGGRTPSAALTIDLRWIATRTLAPAASSSTPAAPLARTSLTPPATSSAPAVSQPAAASYSTILTELRSWESARAAR
ncbi:MAG TPA: hypothetical protein VG714_04795 [Acidobacteriaceae bacterium]|nr:hypothetical protein [Acidobacteriaceae bacterium]